MAHPEGDHRIDAVVLNLGGVVRHSDAEAQRRIETRHGLARLAVLSGQSGSV